MQIQAKIADTVYVVAKTGSGYPVPATQFQLQITIYEVNAKNRRSSSVTILQYVALNLLQ